MAEAFVYGSTLNAKVVQQHRAVKHPKIWQNATGFTVIKIGNVEMNLEPADIARLSRCSQGGGLTHAQ